jgi:type I restriction enzyme, S subunit
MPSGWTRSALGEVAFVNPKMGPLSEDAPFVPMDAVHAGKRFVGYYEPRGERAGARAFGGDVLFARITPCLENGKVAQLPHGVGPCGGSTEFIVIRGSQSITSDFVYFWASSEVTRNTAAGLMTGTTGRQRLSWQDLFSIELDLPSIEEQKRIVDVASSVDSYIDALQQQADTARTARNAVLHELLSAGGDDWTETTLGDISLFISKRESPKELAIDTPYVGLEHVEPKTTLIFNWGSVESVSSSVTPFEPEDTLFGRLRPYLHKVAFADFPGVCSPEILVLRSSAKCESKFLYLLCSLDSTIKKCVDMSSGTRMPRTSTTDLASIEVQLPPLDEQKRIVEIVSSMDDVVQSTEQAVVDAKNLRSGLLSDLLSGEHEIPASYDSLLGAA